MDRRSGNHYTLVFYSTKLSYSASQKPSLLCQKDRAARFCPKTGTEPYVEFILRACPKTIRSYQNPRGSPQLFLRFGTGSDMAPHPEQ
ncbi:hypothetical protein B9T54_12590 [Leptospira borgpetersenii serovar Hardjo-bovis]|nr:hypothetical protein B9T54_12590 [Leptospira borgpetersenii serovar Hardjo-bovis]TQE49843.1 hypothetical protein FFZ95_17950 [Leptospira borgpetersenii]